MRLETEEAEIKRVEEEKAAEETKRIKEEKAAAEEWVYLSVHIIYFDCLQSVHDCWRDHHN